MAMPTENEAGSTVDPSAETKITDASTGTSEAKTIEAATETESKTVPISRLNEVIEKRKAAEARLAELEAERAKEAEEAEKSRLAKLPEEEKLKEQAKKAQGLEAETKSLKAENKRLTDALASYLDNEMSGLTAKEKQAIQGMASDVMGQLAALAQAKSAGWIGAKKDPPPTTHNGKPGTTGIEKPKTREEARQAMLKTMTRKA